MSNHSGTIKTIITITGAVAIVAFSAFSLWFYVGALTPFKTAVAKVIPYPAAMVNGHPILIKDVSDSLQLALLVNPQSVPTRQEILTQLLLQKDTQILADKYGVVVSNRQLDEEFNAEKNQDPQNFTAILKKYAMSEAEYKAHILKPYITSQNLQVWFNGQRSLNTDQYLLADSVKSQILNSSSSTSTLISLVKEYSQDPISQGFYGDSGFTEINSLLPELRAPLDSAKVGDVDIVPSRYGIHVIAVTAIDRNGNNNSPRLMLRQIFLKPANYNSWFNQEIKNIKTKIFF